jgi:Fic family protein
MDAVKRRLGAHLYLAPKLDRKELEVIEQIDTLRERLRNRVNQSRRWRGSLARVAFARNIQGSNSVEGYNVTVEDAIAAVEGEEPLDAKEETWLAVTGYRKAMTYVLERAKDEHFTYGTELFRGLHFMMIDYDLSKRPGRWRQGVVFVRNERDEIVYEPPDVDLVPMLMDELVEVLNQKPPVPMLIRAAMGHLNLTLIHPFADGNGRMARCLQTLVLARDGMLAPEFSSIEEYIGRNRQEYYDILQQTAGGHWQSHAETRAWLRFCLRAHYRQAMTVLRRVREIERLWDELDVLVRTYDLPDRTIAALSDASFGLHVRNSLYRAQAEISDFVASRDLKLLVDAGLLIPIGQRRGRYYRGAESLQKIRLAVKEPAQIPDPFDLQPDELNAFSNEQRQPSAQ